MVSVQDFDHRTETKHKLVPPDGGWGHLITSAVTVMNLVSIIPQVAFGLTFGSFLASIGDETTGTTIVNGSFVTVQSFTGLAAVFLLQKYSYRKVGLLGATLFSIGSFAIIFVTDLKQMVVCFGILEGLGFGLMLPASFSAFNCYFNKRINLMMGVAQAIMIVGAIIYPPVIASLMECYGYRTTVTIHAVLSLLNFPAMAVLQPVQWHMKKVPVNHSITKQLLIDVKSKSLNEEVLRDQIKPLLSKKLEEELVTNSNHLSFNSLRYFKEQLVSRPRFSVISFGDRATSIAVINEPENGEGKPKLSSSKCMDLSLLRDFKYLNISFGVSLSYTSDGAFISIIPLILYKVGFGTTDVALMMMVYYGSDLVSRILISIISALYKIKNRYVFLMGSLVSAIFRIVFLLDNTYIWKMTTLAILGFLRCFIQTPLPLVFSEEYNEKFPTAFSLYMAICGFVSLIIGAILSAVKSFTQNDEMVVHVLSAAFFISSFSWMIEFAWVKLKRRTV